MRMTTSNKVIQYALESDFTDNLIWSDDLSYEDWEKLDIDFSKCVCVIEKKFLSLSEAEKLKRDIKNGDY